MASKKNLTVLSVLVSLLLLVVVLTGCFGFWRFKNVSDTSFWASRFEQWGVLLITWLFVRSVEHQPFLLWKEQKKNFLFYLLSIAGMLAVITVILAIVSIVEKSLGIKQNDAVIGKMTAIMCSDKTLLVFVCFTAAVVEELLFRGFLQPRLQLIFNSAWPAIALSSLAFGLSHFGYSDLNRMLFPFIIGFVFSCCYYKYRNLTSLVICHFLMDLYSTYSACK